LIFSLSLSLLSLSLLFDVVKIIFQKKKKNNKNMSSQNVNDGEKEDRVQFKW